jgi:hypothetical protein
LVNSRPCARKVSNSSRRSSHKCLSRHSPAPFGGGTDELPATGVYGDRAWRVGSFLADHDCRLQNHRRVHRATNPSDGQSVPEPKAVEKGSPVARRRARRSSRRTRGGREATGTTPWRPGRTPRGVGSPAHHRPAAVSTPRRSPSRPRPRRRPMPW